MTETILHAVLTSPLLVVVLLVMVIVDGPFPFLPSEPVLFASVAMAMGTDDLPMLAGLVGAAVVGSLLGDLLLYGLGRTSRRVLPEGRGRLSLWVHRHVHARPIVALASVRVVPGGRLASVTAAGRADLPGRRFLPASLTSSVIWTTYMTVIGVGLAGLTGGDPLWSLLASLVIGLLVAGVSSLGGHLLRRRTARRTRAEPVPA